MKFEVTEQQIMRFIAALFSAFNSPPPPLAPATFTTDAVRKVGEKRVRGLRVEHYRNSSGSIEYWDVEGGERWLREPREDSMRGAPVVQYLSAPAPQPAPAPAPTARPGFTDYLEAVDAYEEHGHMSRADAHRAVAADMPELYDAYRRTSGKGKGK